MEFSAFHTASRIYLLFIASATLAASSALATSSVPSGFRNVSLASEKTCEVRSKFIDAREKEGKVVWRFEQIGDGARGKCGGLEKNFEVWIWSGRYSRLSESFVYPLSMKAPEPGSEQVIRIEKRSIKDVSENGKETRGWFPSSSFLSEAKGHS